MTAETRGTGETVEIGRDADAEAGRTLLPVATPREAARKAWAAFAGHRAPLALAGVMFALSGLAGLVAPVVFGRIVDAVTGSAEGPGGPGGSASASALVWWGAGAIAVAAVVELVAAWASVTFLARAGEPALARLREEVVEVALGLDHEVVEKAGEGDLLSRAGDDVRVLADALTKVVPLLVRSVVAIAFTAVGFFALDWRLGVAGLLTLPFYAMSLRWYLPRSGPYYRAERAAMGARAEALLTAVHGSATLRAQGLAPAHSERVGHASWRSAAIGLSVWNLLTRFGQRTNRAELIGLLLVLGSGFFLVRGDLGPRSHRRRRHDRRPLLPPSLQPHRRGADDLRRGAVRGRVDDARRRRRAAAHRRPRPDPGAGRTGTAGHRGRRARVRRRSTRPRRRQPGARAR
ncbi:ABC transporter transmembrane domain-containing protein [Nocardioides zeae]|uniref:ABC-type multidrug transport system fused ATPase/permease subunit n=1 Tax=Nocardioides zeae TaxID=1457234 RepID=A0AAJ1U8N3_9ACTN|nr:ABC transporter ATP-binding protein [Nocardioides zeae]MDQ1106406.1 ABC-type multidrug transport system fused ATPase/permease subunit [Nocardioides zeae]